MSKQPQGRRDPTKASGRPSRAPGKRPYSSPRLSEWGALEEITRGPGGAATDGAEFTGSTGV